jgi:hypothetical protein
MFGIHIDSIQFPPDGERTVCLDGTSQGQMPPALREAYNVVVTELG